MLKAAALIFFAGLAAAPTIPPSQQPFVTVGKSQHRSEKQSGEQPNVPDNDNRNSEKVAPAPNLVFSPKITVETGRNAQEPEAQSSPDYFAYALAVLGAIIAGFTLLAIRRQANTMAGQRGLARDEFNATHRPHIKIIAVSAEWKDAPVPENTRYEARGHFVNDGTSPAYIKEIRAKITARLDPYALKDFDERLIEKTELASGEEGEAWLSHDWVKTQGKEIAAVNAAFPPSVYCVGFIRYEDSAKRRRKTGFCYWYDSGKSMSTEERDSPLSYSY